MQWYEDSQNSLSSLVLPDTFSPYKDFQYRGPCILKIDEQPHVFIFTQQKSHVHTKRVPKALISFSEGGSLAFSYIFTLAIEGPVAVIAQKLAQLTLDNVLRYYVACGHEQCRLLAWLQKQRSLVALTAVIFFFLSTTLSSVLTFGGEATGRKWWNIF